MTKGAVHDLSGGASKILWEIKFQFDSRFETHGFYWSDTPDPVNKEAISCWVLVGNPASTRAIIPAAEDLCLLRSSEGLKPGRCIPHINLICPRYNCSINSTYMASLYI